MGAWNWIRSSPLHMLGVCLGILLAVATTAMARLVLAFRQRVQRDEPVLRCIRGLRWEATWPADAYREKLAKRLRVTLGIGAHQHTARGGTQVDLSFNYQGTTWFIAVRDRLQSLQRTLVQRDITDLLVDCTERQVARPTVAVVVPSNGRQENLQLRALRAALVYGATGPRTPASSEFNYEIVAVPVAGPSSLYPPGPSAGI